jgi:hypothetical protein
MQAAGYLYPWDVIGDPAAADLVAGLGLDHVVLAAVYHGTRALAPRHPRHRVVVADRTAAYFPLSDARWRGATLRPEPADWLASTDPFGQATVALRAAGVPVHAWTVFNHVDLPGAIDQNVVNAYGDRYPWALCPAQEPVVEYGLGLATAVAGLPGIDGVELEACGWYGFDHLSAHDKTGGVPLGNAEQYLMSLCFCDACDRRYRVGGIDPGTLRRQVCLALDGRFAGASATGARTAGGATGTAAEADQIDALLGAGLAAAVAEVRRNVADELRSAVTDRIRSLRPELTVLLHADPRPHGTLAFTGVDPARAAGTVDGLVVSCWRGTEALPAAVAGGGAVHASLLAIEGMGGRPRELPEQVAAARAAGASGVRLYHVGLAAAADLDAVRELTSRIHKGE